MNEIRAFVGHSFTEDDGDVVRKFTDYFEQLSKSHLKFSWQHALPAEPKELAEKVVALMANKNVFIGICTKKERVISPASLVSTKLPGGFLKAPVSDFQWKTSDWIIQEIGLAIGRGLDLILLIEEGVRPPGGLQGSIEYISFNRQTPEKSFGKFLEMTSNLLPHQMEAVGAVSEINSPPSPAPSEYAKSNSEDLVPKSDWNRRDFEYAYFHFLMTKNLSKATEIDRDYLRTEHANQNDNRESWLAYCELARILCSNEGDIEKLRKLAEQYPDNDRVLAHLAKALSLYGEHRQAAATYLTAANKISFIPKQLDFLGRAAREWIGAGEAHTAATIVNDMKSRVENDSDELILLDTMLELAKMSKDDDLRFALAERILEIRPGQIETRFSLAYEYSQADFSDLALYHYLRIPPQQRGSATWNNLGVALDQNGLPAKSIDAYRNAEEKDETLAMSNLAQKLMNAGFLKEAKAQCEKALSVADPHQNVGSVLSSLSEVPEREERTQTDLLEKIRPISNFYRDFGRALSNKNLQECSAHWKDANCELEIVLVGDDFRASGSYEVEGLGLLSSMFRVSGKPDRFQIEYKGKVIGEAIVGHVTRTREGDSPPTLFEAYDKQPRVLMMLTSDKTEFRVMESPRASPRSFYSLKRVERGNL